VLAAAGTSLHVTGQAYATNGLLQEFLIVVVVDVVVVDVVVVVPVLVADVVSSSSSPEEVEVLVVVLVLVLVDEVVPTMMRSNVMVEPALWERTSGAVNVTVPAIASRLDRPLPTIT